MSQRPDIHTTRRNATSAGIRSEFVDTKNSSSKLLDGKTFKALLERSRYEGINALVLNDPDQLDPTIGDASCEIRPPLILDIIQDIQPVLKDGDRALVLAHRQAHANDVPDTRVNTVEQALGAANPPAYVDLIRRIEHALGEQRADLLKLCHYFTVSSVWSREEEFKFLYSYRSKAHTQIADEDVLESGNSGGAINVEQKLRSQLATNAVYLFMAKIDELPRHEAPSKGLEQSLLENQLSSASKMNTSHIKYSSSYPHQLEDELVPLMAIFNQILAMLLISFHANRKLAFRVFRSEMTPMTEGTDKQCYTEKFAGAYCVLFEPDHSTGLFRAVQPSEEDVDTSLIVTDCFSKYIAEASGTGLESSNLEEHRAAFEHVNLPWMLLQYAATHPAFTHTAMDDRADFSECYERICTHQTASVLESFQPTREDFEQFNLKTHIPGEVRPNLLNLYQLARKLGMERNLHSNCQIVTGPVRHDLYERINRAVDWQPDHVYTSTIRKIESDMNQIIAQHKSSPEAVFGPWIVRAGSSALSFQREEDADKAIKQPKTNKRKAFAKKVHPENAAFI